MGVFYFAMVRRVPKCEDCDGTGLVVVFDDVVSPIESETYPCSLCGGSGAGPERLVLHRDGQLYDEPGKASGSAKRAGYEPIVYRLDTECEPVDRHMSLDEKLGHAEAKWLHWSARLEALQAEAARLPYGRPTLHKHDPKLTAEDWDELRVLVGNALDHFEREHDGVPPDRIARRRRVESILERIATKVMLDAADAQSIRSHAEVARIYNDWAAGKGPRKCLRVGEVDPLDQTARTACGSTVPAPASTIVREEVACCGCEGAP